MTPSLKSLPSVGTNVAQDCPACNCGTQEANVGRQFESSLGNIVRLKKKTVGDTVTQTCHLALRWLRQDNQVCNVLLNDIESSRWVFTT